MKNNIDIKQANERIANMEKELVALKDLVKNASGRAPHEIIFSIDKLVERINNNGLNEDLVVGDYINVKLYTGEIARVFITGIQHDEMENGKLANYSFGVTFVDYEFKMNDTDTNKTSWDKSKMRNTYMPRIFTLLPEVLRNNIVPVKKFTSAGGGNKELITTIDKLFLFSEMEIYGVSRVSFEGEGKQYKFFEEEVNCEIPNYPWLRSPYYSSSNYFCYISSSGYSNINGASISYGVAFGFCI